ncbi:MAG: tyrosine decarboxylase MfnA [Euryarchaeota archaeon]|nr:tyrosine decarboxylase MfnA [Euryarchaeota archaeon]
MNEKGLPLVRVLDALRDARSEDFSYSESEVLGSMCTAPHEVAREAARLFEETNLGDPGHFPGLRRLESEYLDMLLELVSAPEGATGLFLSGGTEGNVIACAAARARFRARRGKGPGSVPNVVVSEEAHFSFDKAARLLDLELRRVPVDEERRIDLAAAEAAVDDDTCLIVAITGTTEYGAIDPVERLGALATTHDLPLHVDAALGGFILPFLPAAGRAPIPWDMAVEGVASITMDPHKMGQSTIPGGSLLVRDPAYLEPLLIETPYVTTKAQAGVLGTRPGAGVAAAWAVARHLGREGYHALVTRCLETTDRFRRLCERNGLNVTGGPLNVLLVHTSDPAAVQEDLSKRGWRVNTVPRLGAVRIVVMPHVTEEALGRFLPELVAAVAPLPPNKVTS